MVSFKEKTQSNCRLTMLFDVEDDRLGAKGRRFRFFKQALIFNQVLDSIKDCCRIAEETEVMRRIFKATPRKDRAARFAAHTLASFPSFLPKTP